jgi:DNA invertase Pin-like site-specific DNA recombinase
MSRIQRLKALSSRGFTARDSVFSARLRPPPNRRGRFLCHDAQQSNCKERKFMSNIYGYVRVSSAEQNENRQLDAMTALGIPPERVFIDKLSGKDRNRPRLIALMSAVQQGDKVIVESISRFARNTRDLLELVEQLAAKGVEFVSQKEHIDTTTPTGKFTLTIFGAVAELERGYTLQRVREGIAAAKARGKHLGRPLRIAPNDFGKLVTQWENKQLELSDILKLCGGISESTFYRRLREHRYKHRLRR